MGFFSVIDNTFGHIESFFAGASRGLNSEAKAAAKGVRDCGIGGIIGRRGARVINDTLMRGPSYKGGQWFNRGAQAAIGGGLGAGYSYASDDKNMGGDIALGVLGAGALRVGKSVLKQTRGLRSMGINVAKEGISEGYGNIRAGIKARV